MTFSYIAQTTFKRAHKSIYETLKIVFKFTAKQVCQKPLFTETPALGSRSWADLLQAALSDGATCVLAGMLEMQHSLWCVFQTSPNFSKWEKDAQRTVTKQLSVCTCRLPISAPLASDQLPRVLGLFWPSNFRCIWRPAVLHQKPFFARSLGNSVEKPEDISGVQSRTSTSSFREI